MYNILAIFLFLPRDAAHSAMTRFERRKVYKKANLHKNWSIAYKLYSRVFWIFLPNVIKYDPYFELYRFKVYAFFETQCRMKLSYLYKINTKQFQFVVFVTVIWGGGRWKCRTWKWRTWNCRTWKCRTWNSMTYSNKCRIWNYLRSSKRLRLNRLSRFSSAFL